MKKLLDKYTDKQILKRLVEIYPDQKPSSYLKALKTLRGLKPKITEFTVFPSKYSTYGRDDKDGGKYDLDFTRWEEWLGMGVKTKKDRLTSLCYCLWKMTYSGFDQRTVQNKIRMLNNRVKEIKAGLPTPKGGQR